MLDRIQMISRIATGIHLRHGITKGTIDSEELISEFLNFGTTTPAQITAISVDKLKGIVDGINGITGILKETSEVKAIEDRLLVYGSVLENMEGVADNFTVPKDDAYKDELNTLKGLAVDWGSINTLIDELSNFLELSSRLSMNDEMRLHLIKLKASVTYTQTLSLVKYNNYSQKETVKNSEVVYSSLQKVYTSSIALSELPSKASNGDKIIDMLNSFEKSIKSLTEDSPSIDTLYELLKSRHLRVSSVALKHVSGFLNGHSDILHLFKDLEDKWIKDAVRDHSGNLANALNQLKTFEASTRKVHQSFVSEAVMLEEVSKIRSKIPKYSGLADKLATLPSKIHEILGTPSVKLPTSDKDKVDKAIPLMAQLPAQLKALEKLMNFSEQLKLPENAKKLGNIIEIVNQDGKNQLENTLKMFKSSTDVKETLLLPVKDTLELLKDNPIHETAANII